MGEKVTLRYDPATARRAVQVHHDGRFIETAKPVDLYANCYVKRDRPSWNLTVEGAAAPPPSSGIRLSQHPDEEDA